MAESVGDYGYVVESLLRYLNGKGQIPSATAVSSIVLLEKMVEKRFGIRLGLVEFVESWVELSQIEPARYKTVAQQNAEIVSRIGAQVNYVQEQGTRTKFLPLGRRKKE